MQCSSVCASRVALKGWLLSCACSALKSHAHWSVCLQTTLFTNAGYTIFLKATIGQNVLCQAINPPDQSKCACTSDYYLVDIEDASHTTYAAVIVPANKPVGAGAFQRALLQSLNRGAVALVVPSSLDLGQIYRWVLVLQPVVNFTIRFGVI
jgi:hypothetical protein